MTKRNADVQEPPKRPQSGYGQFVGEKRAEISATLLKEGVEKSKIMLLVSKRAGELWKSLGEAEQKSYNQKSETLVAAYTKELDAFKEANPEFKKVKKLKRGESEKPPTRPPGAYAMWTAENRVMLTEKVMKACLLRGNKKSMIEEVHKECRSMYDALPEEARKTFEEKAEAAKVKFQAESKEWKQNHTGEAMDDSGKSPEKKKSDGKGPKRPNGAYPQWLSDNRAMLLEKVMKEHNVEKSQAAVMLYKEGKSVYDALPEAEKNMCVERARVALAKFQAESKAWKTQSKGAVVNEDGDKSAESP